MSKEDAVKHIITYLADQGFTVGESRQILKVARMAVLDSSNTGVKLDCLNDIKYFDAFGVF